MQFKVLCCILVLFSANALQLRSQNSLVQYEIPELFLSESSAVIHGNFDGNTDNTTILFENEGIFYEAEVLSESTNKVTFKTPPQPGIYEMVIDEEQSNVFLNETVRVAEMQLSVGKTNMRKGQKTQLYITILGLHGYTKPISVEIKNLSPLTIKLPEGKTQIITLQNKEGSPEVSHEMEIRAIARGSFDIEANLKPKEVLIFYDPSQLEKEMNTLMNDSSFVIADPVPDSIKIIEDLARHKYIPYPEAPTPEENERILKELLRKLYEDDESEENKITGRSSSSLSNLLKLIKQFLEEQQTKSRETTGGKERIGGPVTTPGWPTTPDDEDRKDSTICTCGISGEIKHATPNKCYTLTSILKDAEVAQKLRAKGIKIPEKRSDGFRGENLSIIPGTAYSTNYGDIVGGYANAVANMWGKEVENNAAYCTDFETEPIATKAKAYGTHYMEIKPAEGEWSQVIGVAVVRSATNAKAIDPVEFERKLMKEFGRGKRTAELGFMIFGIATTGSSAKLVDELCQLIISTTMDASGVSERMERKVTTDADLYAKAKTLYSVKVNENQDAIKKRSWVRRVARIDRHLKIKDLIQLKPTEIVTKGTCDAEAKRKEQTIIVSAKHPTRVRATINARAYLQCKAMGNGVAECSVESKTATCVVGICVNKDGGVKYKLLQDSGVFIVGDKAKEIAESESSKFEKAINNYFDGLSSKLDGKSSEEIKKYIGSKMENELRTIAANWVR